MTRDENGKVIGRECQADGCDKTVDDGVLWRVNPKGQPGIFMCGEHRAFVNSWEQRLVPERSSVVKGDES